MNHKTQKGRSVMNKQVQKKHNLSTFMVEILELGHRYPDGWVMIPVRASKVTVNALVRRNLIAASGSRILPGFSLTEKGRSVTNALFNS